VDTTGHDHFGLHKPPPTYGHTAVMVPKRIDRGGESPICTAQPTHASDIIRRNSVP
jgi:hypothetical protein